MECHVTTTQAQCCRGHATIQYKSSSPGQMQRSECKTRPFHIMLELLPIVLFLYAPNFLLFCSWIEPITLEILRYSADADEGRTVRTDLQTQDQLGKAFSSLLYQLRTSTSDA